MDKTRSARIISRITTWTLRILMLLVVLFFIAIIATATLGGNGDMQRKSLENVIGSVFRMPAHIHELKMYRIFPEFRVDFAHLDVRPEGDKTPAVIVGRVLFVQDIFQRMLSRPPIEVAEIENFITRPGVFGPYSLHLKSGSVVHYDQAMPPVRFRLTGTYANEPVTIEIPLQTEGAYMRIDGNAPIAIEVGKISILSGLQIEKDSLMFTPMQIALGDHRVTATLVVFHGANGPDQRVPLIKLIDEKTKAKRILAIDQFGEQVVLTHQDGAEGDKAPSIDAIGAYLRGIAGNVRPVDDQGRKTALPKITVN